MTCTPFPTTATTSPAMLQRALDSGLATWSAAVDGALGYWQGARQRGITPLHVAGDLSRWWGETSNRRAPEWATQNLVVLEFPLVRLRDFSESGEPHAVPTLLVPPQADHASCIVDYSPVQSQIKTARAAELTRLYSLDWVPATQETKDAGIEDYVVFMDRAIEQIGGPVNLIGNCQGGWLSPIYAALRPEHVHTLTIAGAPIDFHAGDAMIHDYVRLLSPTDLGFYQDVVLLGGGVMKGEFMSTASSP
jgi:poly(3-hydroxybutyrate) depolymerase